MAEFRNIHTRIWTDAWFAELEPDEKLLFIYLFSNASASVCGMYELPKRNISIDTGIPMVRVSQILDTFTIAGKVYYENGIVWVVNLKKYNDAGDSVKIKTRINKDIAAISDCPLKRKYIEFQYTLSENQDTLSKKELRDGDGDGNETETDTEKRQRQLSTLVKLYEDCVGPITVPAREKILLAVDDYPYDWIDDSIRQCAKYNKRSWAYAESILKRRRNEGEKEPPKQVEHKPITIMLPGGQLAEAMR